MRLTPYRVRVPWRPLVGIGEGTIVQVADAQYAEVVGVEQVRRHRAWQLFLVVRDVPTGDLLTGWGEMAVDVRPIEEVDD